jgi:putative methionine-R-sulfoxide reductase with GAF domain
MQYDVSTVREALRTFQADTGLFAIAVYAIDGDYSVRIAAEGAQCSKCERVHLSTGNIGAVARSGQAHFTADVHSDPTYSSCFADVRGETVVPVLSAGRVVAVIDAESSDCAPIDPCVLATLADRIAPFVHLERDRLLSTAVPGIAPDPSGSR